MSWWKTAIDAIPGVGTVHRTGSAIDAPTEGDHESGGADEVVATAVRVGMKAAVNAIAKEAMKQARNAVMAPIQGDHEPGGARQVVPTSVTVGMKTAAKAIAKKGMKLTGKAGGRAAMRAETELLTRSAMKAYAKKYFKKKVKKSVKRAIKEKMEEYDDAELDYVGGYRSDLISILADATGMSQYELDNLDEQELLDLAYAAANYDDD